ncbi:MAG: hypothetical protein LBR45_04275 [Bacteroidales bacterium]|jgi:hypothetical protein|nr:hypothetical protein [Bacteroidales bacterium]
MKWFYGIFFQKYIQMARGKIIIISVFLLLASGWEETLAQSGLSDSTHCYLIKNDNNKIRKNSRYTPITLLVYNQSNDSVHIRNFNKYVPNIDTYVWTSGEKLFNWELLTLPTQEIEDPVIISGPHSPPIWLIRNKKLREKIEEEIHIVIPPKSLFVSDIYIYGSYVKKEGYYRLRLRYGRHGKCIAEMVIQYK